MKAKCPHCDDGCEQCEGGLVDVSLAKGALCTGRMYEYHCSITRVIDGDTLVCDIDLGFKVWLRGVQIRLADVSAPEKGTPDGERWADWWHAAIAQQGPLFIIRTTKDPKQTFSRWLGSLYLLNGASTADLLDPQRQRRHKHEG